jgi:hypothetical protein
MPKRIKPQTADHERMVSAKFRTTPIKSTIKHITGLPRSAILYKCAASTFWQFRVHLEGKPRKRSTKQEEIAKAEHEAKKIYAQMLGQVTSGEITVQPTTRNTLQYVAKSLWAKNQTRIKNGELNEDKVSKDTYVFERHIKPFFARYDVKDIDLDLLEQFKSHLADRGLSAATQLSYMNVVMALLKEAQIKRFISQLPPKPRVKSDDGVRGFFDDDEFETLRKAIGKNVGKTYDFKSESGSIYRKTRITEELGLLVDFMVETYIRPTDIKEIRHQDIRLVEKSGITFIILEHGETKLHKKNMVSSERGMMVYRQIIDHRNREEGFEQSDYLFMPDFKNRESALQNLSTQFNAILAMAGMERDKYNKPRTLYSLRHTAIVRSLRKGVPIELVASNARTSAEMIRRFYGVHIDNILETGTVYVEKERERRDSRERVFIKVMDELKAMTGDPMYDTLDWERNDAEQIRRLRREARRKTDEERAQELKNREIERRVSQDKEDDDDGNIE